MNLPFSVIILDLDDFKKINDTMGHPAGDYVLTSVSALIANQLQDKDIFARYGGEEFGILMPEAKREDAWKIAETLRQSLDSLTLNFAGREIHVTMSIGIATMDKNHDSFDSLVVAADRQLYISKGKGKNCTSM